MSQRFLQVPWEHEIWGPWRARFPPILMLWGPSEGASTFTQLWGLTNIYKTSDCLGGELATDHEVAKKGRMTELVATSDALLILHFKCEQQPSANKRKT